jgi:hypothetical protein
MVRSRDPIDCSLVPAEPDATSALRDDDAPAKGSSSTAGEHTANGRTDVDTAPPAASDGHDTDAALEEFFRDADKPARDKGRNRRSISRATTSGTVTGPAATGAVESAAAAAVAAPAAAAPRYEARKVHRLVRHVEPWSVLKISLIFYFCLWLIMLVAAVLLWQVASSSGLIDNVQSFIEEIFALEPNSFAFEAGQMFRAYAVAGLVMVVAATGFTVLLAVLFNLISDLTGGVRITVLEEESARPVPPVAPEIRASRAPQPR